MNKMIIKILKKVAILPIIMILMITACKKSAEVLQEVTFSPEPAQTQDQALLPTHEIVPTFIPTPKPSPVPPAKVAAVDDGRPWYVRVDTYNQMVSVYALDENGQYTRLINQFMCTAGKRDNYTKKVFQMLNDEDRYRWKYFETFGGGYCEYVTRIYKPFLFHSMMFETKNEDTLMIETYTAMTFPDSHGCIRLMPQDAKWIYDFCIEGTYVEILDGKANPELVQYYMPAPLIDGKYLPVHEHFGNEITVEPVYPNWDNFPSDGGWVYDSEVYG